MAKRGTYQRDRMQKPTRKLTGVDRELDEARKWQARQMGTVGYWRIKRRIAVHGLLAVYRARKDAAKPKT
jgi:hypothetical protein